jgi:polysaccharide biosynthesis transport protein
MSGGQTDNSCPDAVDRILGDPAIEGLSDSLIEILWRQRRIILVAGVLALVAGFLYIVHATPMFTSTSRVYVEETKPRVFDGDAGSRISYWANYLNTQAERMQSTDILAAAMKAPEMAGLQTLAHVPNPVVHLRRQLTITVGKKDNIISVSFVSSVPDDSAYIVNSIVDAYLTVCERTTRNTLGEVVRILKEEKTKRNQELLAKLEKMVQYRQENENLAFGADQGNNIIVRRLERISQALTEAELVCVETRSYYETAQKLVNDPEALRQLVEARRTTAWYNSSLQETTALHAELNRMERDKADILGRLKAGHPAVAAVAADIDRAERQLKDWNSEFAHSEIVAAEQQCQLAQTTEQELQTYFEQQRAQAIALNRDLAQYALLESDYEQAKKLSDLLDESIQRLDVTTAVGEMRIGILETARPALQPSEPQKAKVMGLALFLGLFVGAGMALVRERLDQRLHSSQEISSLLGLPVLGSVPSMGGAKDATSDRGQKVLVEPDSRDAEAFRTVRTAVFFGVPKEDAKTILLTSPAPGEGKSTVTANLGIAIAQAGQKVLVVDADFRRPMQHTIFNLDRKTRGFSLALAGEMEVSEAVQHTNVANLDVLTSGPDVSNPSEMLNSDSFSRMIEALSGRYDRILVDSPPVVSVTDALILAARCDTTILVLRADVSTRKIASQAREALARVDARILGAVVNDVSLRSDRYGYGGYEYYHHYGRDGSQGDRTHQGHRRETGPVVTAGS